MYCFVILTHAECATACSPFRPKQEFQMKNAKHDRSIQSAVMTLKTDEPTIELKSYSAAGADLARVIIDVTHTTQSRNNPQLVMNALSKKLDGRFQAIAGSFDLVDSGAYTDRITGIVGRTREIVAVSEDNLKGFRALSSNMFMDDEKEMWTMKKTEAGDVLIKTSAEDDLSLLNLLEATASSGYRSAPEYAKLSAMCGALASKVQGGNFVSYVDLNNRITQGFVIATTDSETALVLPQGADEPDEVKLDAVTDIHDAAEMPEVTMSAEEIVEQEVAVSSGRVDVNAIVAYYKRIYNMNPKFFAEWEKRIRSHQFA